MRRTLTSLLIALGVAAGSCGGAPDSAPARGTTTTTNAPIDGPLEVFSYGEMDSVQWWDVVSGTDLIVHADEVVPGAMTIATTDTRGATVILAEDVASASTMRLAPNGEVLAVAEPSSGRGWSLWTIPTTGGEVVVLERAEGRLAIGEFTADSQVVLYRSLSARPGLFAAAVDGAGSTTLAQTRTGDVDPVMGPPTIVGDRAVYATHDEENGVRLWAAYLDRPGRVKLPLPEGVRTVWAITAGADGRHALVEAKVEGLSSDHALYAVWADGRGPAVLLDEGGDHGVSEPVAVGDHVVYRIGDDRFSASLSGTTRIPLLEPAIPIPGFSGHDAAATTDDGTYVFTSSLESGRRELYRFDPATDAVEKLNGELAEHRGVLGGESSDWVLDFALIGDGRHVAYTTGLAGATAQVQYRLYIAPLP